VEDLVRCGFHEGGNITPAGAVADLIVTFFSRGFREAGFVGPGLAARPVVSLACRALEFRFLCNLVFPVFIADFLFAIATDLELTLGGLSLVAGFFLVAAVVFAMVFDLLLRVVVFGLAADVPFEEVNWLPFLTGADSVLETLSSISGA